MNAKDIAKAFVGLARLNTQYIQQKTAILKLVDLLEVNSQDISAQGICNIIWSLGCMQAVYSDFHPSVHSRVLFVVNDRASDVSPQGLSTFLWGLQKMEMTWSLIPAPSQSMLLAIASRVCLKMDPHSAGITLYSLGNFYEIYFFYGF